MWKIKKVEIEGFRGFTKKKIFEFKTPVILLYGGNHQGKSSLLNAIEWCLYGDKCIGGESGIRERVGTGSDTWRTVNDSCEIATVKILMKDEVSKSELTIIRTENKLIGKKGKKIEVYLPDKTKKEGNEAEQEIAKLFRLSFKDFATSIYQHQETIHDFVIQPPSEKSSAMDRLLGLTDYRNILDGINKSDISKVEKQLALELATLQDHIGQAIKIRVGDINEKKTKVQEKGFKEEELNKEKLSELANISIKAVKNFATQIGVIAKEIPPLVNLKTTESFVDSIKNECKRLFAESPDIKEQTEMIIRKSKIDGLLQSYTEQDKTFKSKKGRLKDFEFVTLEDINKGIEEIKKKITEINSRAGLIKEGISLLESALPTVPPEKQNCPLCGKTYPNLLEHLKKEWLEQIKPKVGELEEKKELLEELHIAKKDLDKVTRDISEFLSLELTNEDDPVVILGKEITNIEERLGKIKEAITGKQEQQSAILMACDNIKLLYEILLLENKLEEINKIKETAEWKELDKISIEASNFVKEKISPLVEVIKKCMKEDAEEKITLAGNAINDYFLEITQNPAFQKISIKLTEDRTGKNVYNFEDQEGKNPIPILSQGDLNSLALSIFLGLVKVTQSSTLLGVILMDDASQSLDSQQKVRVAGVINKLAETKNIIISTMDEGFKESLKSKITKTKTVYTFSNWSPDTGPEFLEE